MARAPRAKLRRKVGDPDALLIHARHEVERRIDGAKHRRGQRSRIDDAAAAVDEIVAQGLAARDKAAETAQRFREGADDNIGIAG